MSEEMYGDGGVDYAEKIFAEQRERNRVEAKKQEDFAKKLQLFDIGLRGVNFLINQRADNLEAKQISARGVYLLCENKGNRVIIGGQAILFSSGYFNI